MSAGYGVMLLQPLLLLLVVLVVALRPAVSLNCLQEGDTGETAPREINIEPGHKFRIACFVDPEHERMHGRTAADLYFARDFTGGSGDSKRSMRVEVPASQSRVYNATTLVVEDRLETAVHYTYSCRLRGHATRRPDERDATICSSSVNVGSPPLDVRNFSCIVNNWNNITCNWKLQYNAVKSQYQLQYLLKPSYDPADAPPREQWVLCPTYDSELPEYRTACSITEKTQPVYRTGTAFYNFTMNITNALGTRLQWLGLVDNFAIVLPAAPESVRNTSVTEHSVLLETDVGWPMNSFPRPLDFDVSYISPWDEQPQSVNASSMSVMPNGQEQPHPLPLLITGLKPFTEYRFSVRMRSSATEREDLWSPPAEVTVLTLPTVPAAAPQVDVGSFQLIGAADSRTVLIYWHQIEPSQRNGPNFTYCVTVRDAASGRLLPDLRPSQVTAAYARFTGVSGQARTFEVASCNAVGRSTQTSSLTVPDQRHVGVPPHSVTLRISGPGRYQLFWKHTSQGRRLPDSFTLFPCEHRPDRPYQCQGQLQVWRVPGDARQYNLTLHIGPEYQFAMSANYLANNITGAPATSSGMVWSRCSIPFSREGDQVVQGLSVESTEQHSVTLAWNDNCASQVTVSKVVVIYCEWLGNKCRGEETSRQVNRTGSSGLRLGGLRPYTRYHLSVALVSGGKQGRRSRPQMAQTLPARPDPPTGAQVAAVSSTSLRVDWRPPAWPNGPLVHYEVLVSGRHPLTVPSDNTTLTITGLQAYTHYNVSVRACNAIWRTAGCSQASPLISTYTLPGAPGEMEPLRTQLLNTSAVLLRWRPPSQPGGPQIVYFVRTVSEVDDVNYTQPLVEIPGDQLQLEQLVRPCRPGARSQRHLFWVRAATVLPSGPLLGEWSEPAQQACVLASAWPPGAVVGLVAGGLLLMGLAVLAFCLCSRTKRKWVKMRDIGVNLPSGLERPEKPLHGFRGSDRRSGPAAAGYGRLVSQAGESGGTSGRPLLQECAPVGATDISEVSRSTGTDSNSCSSSATNYTDSGAESEKVGSPTYERMPWSAGPAHLAPYVQAGGPGTPPGGGPPYTKFSPYVDAKAIQSLLARGSVDALPADGTQTDLTRSEPDLNSAAVAAAAAAADAAGQGSPLQYSQIGLRSSAGYVSMASDDALPPPPPAEKEPERPYVALGPPPPPVSPVGFPPYVLAGLPADEGALYSGQGALPAAAAAAAAVRSGAYVTQEKLQPAGIELRDMASADCQAQQALAADEPVLSPKKLATVVSARDPYCRVVTSHQGAPDLGPNVSMV